MRLAPHPHAKTRRHQDAGFEHEIAEATESELKAGLNATGVVEFVGWNGVD